MNCCEKFVLCALLSSIFFVNVSTENSTCDKTQCSGPIRFYEDLNCKPTYKEPGDCCAIKYDCSHLRNRSPDKCYINGHEYEVDEVLREEDKIEPCDIGCFCNKNSKKGVASFTCAIVDCFPKEAKPGCYLRRKLNSCCGAEEICPENPNDTLKCQVDGKTYLDGDRFIPNDNPSLLCQCGEGYEGKNVAPFCRESSCRAESKHAYELREKCAPIYEHNQSPAKNCNSAYRCQSSSDAVIEIGNADKDKGVCEFGELKMNIGDELSESNADIRSECVRCVCEVPPTLTCQRLTHEECKIKYPRDSQ